MSETTAATGKGDINHVEFISTNADATTKFMGALFGYEFQDMGSPETGAYHTFGKDGHGGAVRPVAPGEPGPGTTAYIGVEDIDAATATAVENGATVIVAKQPVPTMGWFAWLKIPGDLVISIWQDDVNAA